MLTLTRRTRRAILMLALGWLAPLPAPARDIRHPESGLPAYAIALPDDWTTQAAEQGNLLMYNANRATVLVLLVAASTEPLDVIAKEAFETAHVTPAARKEEPAEISGCAGFTWFGTMQNAQGDTLPVEVTIVRVGQTHIASASLILATGVAAADEAAARAVWKTLTLLPAPALEAAALPDPELVLTGLEYYEVNGTEWTRYKYRVANLAEYPNELFAPAPDLPPCGTNQQAARTWVDFYDENGKRLNGFCALGNHDQLDGIWFAVETTVAPPDRVYIELTDRRTETVYKSNLAPTTKGPASK